MNANSAGLAFHPEAAKRYDQRAQEILPTVQGLGNPQEPSQKPDIHPVATIRSEDILSAPKLIYGHDALGERSGVFWVSANMRVGWVGVAFQPIKLLADDMSQVKPFRDVVSDEFLLNHICDWLCDTLERRRFDTLSEYITLKSHEAVKDHEIWIPIFRTYSSIEFSIGDVRFRTITRQIMDEWWSRIPAGALDNPLTASALNEKRSELQASLAACFSVRAEEHKAVQIARAAAQNAVALLRFVSPANLNSRLTSYCTPNGAQAMGICTEVFMNGGCIDHIRRGVQDHRTRDWDLDNSLGLRPGVLDNLRRLASDTSTEFTRSLYDALLLYSRQPLASEVSDKLVFTLSALESMLLRDSNEPIQKNLGERMAFLIGQSVQERKGIVRNIDEVYKIRSAFVHHGQTARHVEIVDRFLVNAWTTFSRLLDLVPLYRTKAALLGGLEDLKMS